MYVETSGSLGACSGGWCVGGAGLDFGSSAKLGQRAGGDFDGDGTVEANGAELSGLKGTSVSVTYKDDGKVVVALQGSSY